MKLIDEKGRLFGKVNCFDLLVVLLVVVGIVGMATRLLKPAEVGAEMKTATYHLEISEAQECFKTAFQVGDSLYEDGVLLGTVTEVKVRPADVLKRMPDGTAKMVERTLYYDINLTFTTDRFNVDEGYYVDSREFLAGTGHIISNGFASVTAVVRDIEMK